MQGFGRCAIGGHVAADAVSALGGLEIPWKPSEWEPGALTDLAGCCAARCLATSMDMIGTTIDIALQVPFTAPRHIRPEVCCEINRGSCSVSFGSLCR